MAVALCAPFRPNFFCPTLNCEGTSRHAMLHVVTPDTILVGTRSLICFVNCLYLLLYLAKSWLNLSFIDQKNTAKHLLHLKVNFFDDRRHLGRNVLRYLRCYLLIPLVVFGLKIDKKYTNKGAS